MVTLERVGYNLRRVRQTVNTFANWQDAFRTMARKGPELSLTLRDGRRISLPNVPGARVPVYEIFAEDAYRLGWFTADLPADFGALDIGGHIGCFSVALATEQPEARIWAFEASPSTAAYTRRNVEQNGLDGRILVENVAISSEAGFLTFADNAGASGLNGITAPEGTETIQVPAVTFADAVAAADRPIRLVKIDTEGAEYDIVLGSNPDDWAGVDRVVLEFHDVPGHGWDELADFFATAGLSVVHREDATDRLGTVWLSRGPLDPPAAG